MGIFDLSKEEVTKKYLDVPSSSPLPAAPTTKDIFSVSKDELVSFVYGKPTPPKTTRPVVPEKPKEKVLPGMWDAPTTMTAKQAYDVTNANMTPKSDVVVSGVRGLAKGIVKLPTQATGFLRAAAERPENGYDTTRLLTKQMHPDWSDAMIDNETERLYTINGLPDEDKTSKKLNELADKINKTTDTFLKTAPFLKDTEKEGINSFISETMEGGVSLLTAMGLTVLTKSSIPASAYFATTSYGSAYEAAHQAGATPEKATMDANLSFVSTAAWMKMGQDNFLKLVPGTVWARTTVRALNNAFMGAGMTSTQNAIDKLTYDDKRNIWQGAAKAAVQFALLGLPFGVAQSTAEQAGVKKTLIEKVGLTPEQADTVIAKVIQENAFAALSQAKDLSIQKKWFNMIESFIQEQAKTPDAKTPPLPIKPEIQSMGTLTPEVPQSRGVIGAVVSKAKRTFPFLSNVPDFVDTAGTQGLTDIFAKQAVSYDSMRTKNLPIKEGMAQITNNMATDLKRDFNVNTSDPVVQRGLEKLVQWGYNAFLRDPKSFSGKMGPVDLSKATVPTRTEASPVTTEEFNKAARAKGIPQKFVPAVERAPKPTSLPEVVKQGIAIIKTYKGQEANELLTRLLVDNVPEFKGSDLEGTKAGARDAVNSFTIAAMPLDIATKIAERSGFNTVEEYITASLKNKMGELKTPEPTVAKEEAVKQARIEQEPLIINRDTNSVEEVKPDLPDTIRNIPEVKQHEHVSQGEERVPVIPGASGIPDVPMIGVLEITKDNLSPTENRALIRVFTGTTRIGDAVEPMISKRAALKEVLRKSAQASKIGYNEGKAEGKAEVKQVKAEGKAEVKQVKGQVKYEKWAANIEKEYTKQSMSLVKEVKDLRKGIDRMTDNKSIAPEYQDLLYRVRAMFDLDFHSQKTMARIDAKRKAILEGKVPVMDSNIANFAKRKNINDMTVDQLRVLHDYMSQMELEGKQAQEARNQRTENRLARVSNALVRDLKAVAQKKEGLWDGIKDYLGKGINPEHMAEFLGPSFKHFFFDKLMDADRIKIRTATNDVRTIEESFQSIPKEKIQAIDTTIVLFNGQELPLDTLMGIYANSKGKDNLTAMFDSGIVLPNGKVMAITEYNLPSLLKLLPGEYKQVVDSAINDVIGPSYDLINSVNQKVNGATMGKVDGVYIPEYRQQKAGDTVRNPVGESVFGVIARESQAARAKGTHKSFLKERSEFVERPLESSFLGMISRFINDKSQFVAYSEAVKEWSALLNNPEVRQGIINAHGKAAYDTLVNHYLTTVPTQRQYDRINPLIDRAIRGAGVAYLAGNMVSVAIQPIAATNSMVELGPKGPQLFYEAFRDFMNHPMESYEFVNKMSTLMSNRALDVQLMKVISPDSLQGKLDVGEASFALMQLTDATVAYPAWLAGFNKSIKERGEKGPLTKADLAYAVEAGDSVVRKSQAYSSPSTAPQSFKGGALEKAMNQFMVQVNILYNQNADAFHRAKIGKDHLPTFALKMVLLNLMPAIVMQAVQGGALNQSPKEYIQGVLQYLFMQAPYIGGVFSSFFSGFDGYSPPALRLLSDSLVGARDISQGKVVRGGLKLGAGVSAMLGSPLPYVGIKRPIEGMIDLINGKTKDPRVLVWGAAKIEKLNPPKKKKTTTYF